MITAGPFALDLETRTERLLDTGKGQVMNPQMAGEHLLVFQNKPDLQAVDLNSGTVKKSVRTEKTIVYTGDRSLSLYRKNDIKKLSPLGEGHYIWASVSPDQQKILFTLAGRGPYICDPDGNILYDLGYAHAPKWSPDGQWILYMVDKDDGHQYTSSEIYVTSLDGRKRFRLTEESLIALYPNWSPEGMRITFHSEKGEIFLVQLSYEREGE